MNAEFVEPDAAPESNRFVRIQGRPIAGKPATLRVQVSSAIKSPAFQFVSMDSRPLQTLDLQSADPGEFTGAVALPTEPFRVAVTGSDESDLPVQRVWHGLFHAEVIEVVPPAGEPTVTAGSEMSVTFTIRNHGPAARLHLVASDQRGKVIAVEPATLELGAGAEGDATVRLSLPAAAPANGEVSVPSPRAAIPRPQSAGSTRRRRHSPWSGNSRATEGTDTAPFDAAGSPGEVVYLGRVRRSAVFENSRRRRL